MSSKEKQAKLETIRVKALESIPVPFEPHGCSGAGPGGRAEPIVVGEIYEFPLRGDVPMDAVIRSCERSPALHVMPPVPQKEKSAE